MGSNLHVDSEWQQLIDSFPEGSSTLEIVATCINKFGDGGKGLTFSDWGRIVRQYLECKTLVITEPTHTVYYTTSQASNLRDSIYNYLKNSPYSKAADIAFALDVSRKEVNSLLYQMLKDECCSVNSSYQWCIIKKEPITCIHDYSAEYQVDSLVNIHLDRKVARYAEIFANLSVYCRLGRKAPHKAIMLLSVMDLISTQQICINKIEFSKTLEDYFARNWKKYVGVSSLFHPKAGTPFWHMNSEPFWRLVPVEEDKEMLTALQMGNPTSARTTRKLIRYAEIDKELFDLLQDETNRAMLRTTLIKHYL